jgi:hypothetical protein
MTLPLTDETKQFIIDHWAAIQPKDISAGWNVSAVEFEGDDALVTCNAPVPPSPRVVRVPLARVEAWAAQMGHPAEPERIPVAEALEQLSALIGEHVKDVEPDDDTDNGEDDAPVKKATSKKK